MQKIAFCEVRVTGRLGSAKQSDVLLDVPAVIFVEDAKQQRH